MPLRSSNTLFKYGPLVFSFVGGYLDASGYVLAGTFTGHMTGALVLAAVSAAGANWRMCALRILGIASFLFGVFAAALWEQKCPPKPPPRLLMSIVLVEIALLLSAFASASLSRASFNEILVCFLSLALGLQNGIWHRLGGVSVHTTFLTGLMITFVSEEAESTHSPSTGPAADRRRSDVRVSSRIWLSFVAGALGGGFAAIHFHSFCLLGAASLLAVLLLVDVLCAITGRIQAQ